MFGTYRTFLALMVVALHIGGAPAIGAYAVFGFYILSGYFMTLVMHDEYDYSLFGVVRFGVNRFLRIYPLYWASILLAIAIIGLAGQEYTKAFHKSIYLPVHLWDWAKNILVFFPLRESPRLTPPAWALTVEVFFYVCIAFGISRKKNFVVAWLLLSIGYHMLVNLLGLGWSYKYIIVPAASLPFSTGALIYHYHHILVRLMRHLPFILYRYAYLFILTAILTNWLMGFLLGGLRGIFFYINFVLQSLMIISLLDSSCRSPRLMSIDRWLGDFSYPIFLVHYQAGIITILLLSVLNLELRRPSPPLFFLSLPLTFFISYLMIKGIERPVERWRKWVRNSHQDEMKEVGQVRCASSKS